jgi:D-methionine transport system substrate-binding protein
MRWRGGSTSAEFHLSINPTETPAMPTLTPKIALNHPWRRRATLDAGEVEANSYQHLPLLESQIKARGYKISPAGYRVTIPLGFYSKHVKSLADLPPGAKVGVQNDPSNSGRALQLLQKAGVIKLKPGAGINATVQAGLVPTRDAIAIEAAKSPYANLLAVRTVGNDKPWVVKRVKAPQSPEVKKLLESTISGSMVPAF